jgi:phosphatidylserine/phosphatidylglycerophosphate/cardiolipin synthase-like enzyme
VIVSPFVTKKRTLQMMQNLKNAIANSVKVVVVTRPSADYKGKDISTWVESIEFLKEAGVTVIQKSNIHQKFAVIDQKIVWYGSINLLSFGSAEESIMRLESPNIAFELLKSIN